ncbi:putative N-acetylglucosamine kinase [Rivularia sp. PCC 7116]|uniref:N-acetylglucosamine kinase n=1 Tax=Rivularia sp. PCC 7116 TaxID=373994 RepID=UPI00029F2669|nr:BadF/BadG/BcrA/BcrD ATPase family protein [Rivularia sp. PCC 7116]AFY56193.1 putative N-acetylglucosamine kinase [Rivularia sp. PCC 7116]
MPYVLGIDGGGSKTVCVLMNDKREIFGRGESGSSNYQSVGIEAAKFSIESAINTALTQKYNIKIDAICLGLAGVGRTQDIEVVKNIVQEIPATRNIKPQNIIISHDALIALVGGIGKDTGIVVAAGTGAIVFGKNHRGETKRVGGWGYILGDEGGAYQIAIAGMNAALKSYDGREISTSLLEDFTNHFGLSNIEELIEVVYRRGLTVKEIAALAPIVDNAAFEGDPVANQIIDNAVSELVKATVTVIDGIFVGREDFEIVTTGSVWKGKSQIWERFVSCIGQDFVDVKVIFPKFEAAYGAGLLGLRCLG